MRRLAVLSLASLAFAGCSTLSPHKIVENGQRHEFSSANAPKALAECTAINARSFSTNYTSSVAEMIRPDNYQVVVSELLAYYHPIIVAQTAPAPAGSQLVLFTSSALDAADTGDWIARLRKGC